MSTTNFAPPKVLGDECTEAKPHPEPYLQGLRVCFAGVLVKAVTTQARGLYLLRPPCWSWGAWRLRFASGSAK